MRLTHLLMHSYSLVFALQLDKQHVEGMEVYSTVLWHLKRETDLCYLAQDLVSIDRHAPQVCLFLFYVCVCVCVLSADTLVQVLIQI